MSMDTIERPGPIHSSIATGTLSAKTGPNRLNSAGYNFSRRADQFSFSSLISHHTVDDFGQSRLRAETGETFQFFQARHAPEHVLESRLIRLIVRNELDGRRTPGPFLD